MSAAIASQISYGTGPSETAEAPKLLAELQGVGSVPEGEPVHLEVRVSPFDVQVDWFKDGRQLSAGSRFNTVFDRGYACLDIVYTFPEDAGLYSCLVSNQFGSISSNQVTVEVIAEEEPCQSEIEASLAGLNLEATPGSRLLESDRELRNRATSAPVFFRQPVASITQLFEGEPLRVEAQLEAATDNSLVVEWCRDGKPLGTGSRFNTFVDRGFVVLEIAYCYPEDSGTYICVATNSLGATHSSPIHLSCEADENIVTKSILDATSMQTLKFLEEPGEEYNSNFSEVQTGIPPSFKAPVEPASLEVTEDSNVLLHVPVDTGNGNRLTFEWRRDGEIVKNSSRITGKLEMGRASLVIRYVQPTDEGVYTCHIETEYGHAESQPARISCETTGSIDGGSQLPGDKSKGMQAIDELEANLKAVRGQNIDEEVHHGPPSILFQPQPVGEIDEGQPIYFEVQVQPAADATLTVEWLKDDKQLSMGTRFRAEYERGLATLQILHCIPEDSGNYWCRVHSIDGEVNSQQVSVIVNPGASVITQSNLLQGSEGYKLIKAIEEIEDSYGDTSTFDEPEEPNSRPNFDVPPQAAVTVQGAPVRFLVRISGKPTPEVSWFINDELIIPDSMTKVYTDGAISYLEIGRCINEIGANRLRVVATNKLGEASAETVLTVTTGEQARPDLKHVAPENPFKKMMVLKKVERSQELSRAMSKAKPSAESIMKMERGTEMKARMFRSPEVLEAEKMLDQMALGLRKSDINKHMANGETVSPQGQ